METSRGAGEQEYRARFQAAYDALNAEQRRAVDTTEGPVMVIAGPGTGKTQVLALRIAHILAQSDTPAHGILALTFTRAGVRAMRERLLATIGPQAREVRISTFHSFAIELVEQYYALLDLPEAPALIDDQRAVLLIDELLEQGSWEYLRPRGDTAKYFSDLRSLVSLMKREQVTIDAFREAIEHDIDALKHDPASISSRGETKGQLKKEIQKQLEALDRTKEVVAFSLAYEALKRERGLMDYDDVLDYAVRLVQSSDEVCAEIREGALYVLVDEHQDSSGVQNAFLAAVWKDVEQPNIFVVGDDRQLIYGFGGAKQEYFESFKTAFGTATLITLVDNYRSTAPILSLADTLLKSSLTTETLRSNRPGGEQVQLAEYSYARDEIIAAGLAFKTAIDAGTPAHECALLVPKNRQIRTAVGILRDMGLPVRAAGSVSLFALPETESIRTVLRIIVDPYDSVALARSLFDQHAAIPPLAAHAFLKSIDPRKLSVEQCVAAGSGGTLFAEQHPVALWGTRLSAWIDAAASEGLEAIVHRVGSELLIDTASEHEVLMRRVEVVRTMLHLATAFVETTPHASLTDFLAYLDRMETYGQALPVATLLGGTGISVLTLHGSKGLEFETVWIAHLNESVLMAQKRLGFTLPTAIEQLVEARDRAVATREVYVAITRAKAQCTISYARTTSTDGDLELAHLVADLPDAQFIKKDAATTEAELVAIDPAIYVTKQLPPKTDAIETLIETVQEEYAERKVSVTLLNNFFECPWKWYFRNLLQLPELKSESQLFGSAVHSTIEGLITGTIPPMPAAITEAVKSALEKEGIAAGVLTRLTTEGVSAVQSWVSNAFDTLAADHVAERSLSYKEATLPHLTMYGKIDLTEHFPDGTITVTDFKTGSAKTTGVIEKLDADGRLSSHLRQLAMYAYLIRGVEKKDVTTAQLLYLEADPAEKNARYRTHITDEQIDLLQRDITDYDRLVRTGEWISQPCHHQSYGKQEVCEYCALAKKVYGI